MHLEGKGNRNSMQKLAMEIRKYQAKNMPANMLAGFYQEWQRDTFADPASREFPTILKVQLNNFFIDFKPSSGSFLLHRNFSSLLCS